MLAVENAAQIPDWYRRWLWLAPRRPYSVPWCWKAQYAGPRRALVICRIRHRSLRGSAYPCHKCGWFHYTHRGRGFKSSARGRRQVQVRRSGSMSTLDLQGAAKEAHKAASRGDLPAGERAFWAAYAARVEAAA
jgi:hypothetical protein